MSESDVDLYHQVVSLSASQASILPPYVPPLPRPETAAREDNRLVPGPLRGPYDYQVGLAEERSRI